MNYKGLNELAAEQLVIDLIPAQYAVVRIWFILAVVQNVKPVAIALAHLI